MKQTEKIFINLTNGLEALRDENLDVDNINFIRIQSSHCEAHQFGRIFDELDYNFLMHAALGSKCIVYDYGAQTELSKAIYIGLEWIKFVLNKRWLDKHYVPKVKGKKVTAKFEEYYNDLSKLTKKKIDYFKKFLLTDEIWIEGKSEVTTHDNDYEYYRELLKSNL